MKIGETTTDPLNGRVFSYLWVPSEPGKYTITAIFQGTESYWRSYGSTAVAVVSVPEQPPLATAEQAQATKSVIANSNHYSGSHSGHMHLPRNLRHIHQQEKC